MGGSIRVLHVDDEPEFATLAATYLERENERFAVETTTDPDEALELVADGEYDCVVSDYDMPGRNGIEFLEAVRRDFPELPFILFTGKGGEEVASDAISAGVTDYLQKDTGTSQYTVLANRISNSVEQFRSRQVVEETERKLSQLAEKTDDILFMFDSEWSELLYINSAYEDVWGRSIAELEADPRSFLENIHPEDQALIDETFERILDGKPTEVEYRILTPDGEERWLYSEGKPIHDDEGTFTRIVGAVRDITEQKRREAELQRQRNRFRAVFDESFDAMVLADDDGRFVDANRSATELFGLPEPELRDQSIEDFAAESFDVEAAWDDFYQSDSDRGTFPLVRPDGEERLVEYAATADVVPGEHLSVLRDVTEREERVRELREEQAFTTAALEGVVDFYWAIDLDGQVTRWSDTDGSVTGYTAEEAIGRHSSTFHPDDHVPRIEQAIEEMKATGDTRVEADLLTKDGERRHYFFTGIALTDENGEIHSMCGTGQDVTERKRQEARLEAEKERFRTLFEHLTQPTVEVEYEDDEPIIQQVNPAFEAAFGYDESTLVGESLDAYIVPPDREEEARDINQRVRQGGRLVSEEVTRLTADGRREFLLQNAVYEDGSGGFAVYMDITERKKRERELLRQNERLDEFASVLSHDLRNPLNVADGRLGLAMEDCDSEHLEPVAQALGRMDTLIEDTLALARAGETISDTEPVELADLVDSCWQGVETASATIENETDGIIEADETRLQQLLENLLRNAIDHGGSAVTITVGDLPTGFYVEDDGPGITADEIDEVFEAGYGTDDNGTGLGLSIVQEITEAHEWDIRVTESEAGGARFEITGVELAAA